MNILSHIAKNTLDSTLMLYYTRSLYQNTRLLERQESYLDLWYSKSLYGKVDTDLRLVQPSSTHMKELNSKILDLGGRTLQVRDTEGKQGVMALNFVADAFKAMASYMRDLEFKGNLNQGTFFYPLVAHKGWKGASAMYNRNIEALYALFINGYIFSGKEKINKRIRTFDDYVPIFKDFLNFVTEQGVIITKSGLILNIGCPHSISGLVIEISAERDYSDDMNKYNSYFKKEEDMKVYLDIATKFGFYVDMNTPWRLVANLASPAWTSNPILKEIVDQYFPDSEGGYTVGAVFDKYYDKIYVADPPSLKTIMLQFYNSLVEQNPTFHTPKVCRKINEVRRTFAPAVAVWEETISRRSITLEQLNKRYDDSFWISLYAQIRFREMRLNLSEHQIRHYLNQIKHRTQVDGYLTTLKYIEQEITNFLEERLGRFIFLKEKGENLLISGQLHDIIF